jgi:hypothetical protein
MGKRMHAWKVEEDVQVSLFVNWLGIIYTLLQLPIIYAQVYLLLILFQLLCSNYQFDQN